MLLKILGWFGLTTKRVYNLDIDIAVKMAKNNMQVDHDDEVADLKREIRVLENKNLELVGKVMESPEYLSIRTAELGRKADYILEGV